MNLNGTEIDVTRLYDIADAIVERYKKRLTQIDAKGTGALIESVKSDVELRDQTVSLVLEVLDYYYYIENGRGPTHSRGWQNPIDDLSTWIRSKIQRGKFLPKPGKPLPTTQKQIRQVSWAVYKTITKHGYEREGDKAMPLQRTIDGSMDLLTEFAQVVADQIGQEVEAEFATLSNPSKNATKTYPAKRTRISPTST